MDEVPFKLLHGEYISFVHNGINYIVVQKNVTISATTTIANIDSAPFIEYIICGDTLFKFSSLLACQSRHLRHMRHISSMESYPTQTMYSDYIEANKLLQLATIEYQERIYIE